MENQREDRLKMGEFKRGAPGHEVTEDIADDVPIPRHRVALRGAQKRQGPVRGRSEAVYVADTRELGTHASHRLCDRCDGAKRMMERMREKFTLRETLQHDSRDLLVQGDRVPLGGALQRDRAVLGGAEAPGVVNRRELGPHAADRLWSYR